MVIGIVISFTGYSMVRQGEEQQFRAEFDRIASDQALAVQRQLDRNLDLLYDARDFIYANGAVSRDQFHTFVHGDLARQSGVQALEWVPRVPDAQRMAFETAMQQEGLAQFQLTDRAPDGRLIPAGVRPDHFPVTYIEPIAGNEAALGIDLAGMPGRQDAITPP